MENERVNIVFAGNVDHGKSTLIGRLLCDTESVPESEIERIKKICKEQGNEFEYAFILDHMEEERQQGITIDTAQKFFKTQKRDYVIIDAPGHKEFLKNMITGASQADAGILLVDAKEGIREQTKRHAYLLSFLGIKQVIAVINKIDLINFDKAGFERIKKELLEFLDEINIKPLQAIPISAKHGDNVAKRSEKINWYNGASLLEALDELTISSNLEDKPLRFSVQDVYKINDKRILAGRMESGVLKEKDEVIFLPSEKKTRIMSIEIFSEERKQAFAGECIGITTEDPLFIERGEIMCDPKNQPKVLEMITANLFWMAKDPLKIHEIIKLKCTTQEIDCFLEEVINKIDSSTLEKLSEKDSLKETEAGRVKLKLKNKIVAESFDEIPELGRFVIIKDGNISAGGIIVEPGMSRTASQRPVV